MEDFLQENVPLRHLLVLNTKPSFYILMDICHQRSKLLGPIGIHLCFRYLQGRQSGLRIGSALFGVGQGISGHVKTIFLPEMTEIPDFWGRFMPRTNFLGGSEPQSWTRLPGQSGAVQKNRQCTCICTGCTA